MKISKEGIEFKTEFGLKIFLFITAIVGGSLGICLAYYVTEVFL